MIRYEIDKNGFLTGNWAEIGSYPSQVELEKPLDNIDLNLRWNGKEFYMDNNPVVEAKLLKELRRKREEECFSVINRGALWYNSLTQQELQELQDWYNKWLQVTETKTIPDKPRWLVIRG